MSKTREQLLEEVIQDIHRHYNPDLHPFDTEAALRAVAERELQHRESDSLDLDIFETP